MKNITWKRVAIILGILLAAGIAFGAGYAMGAFDTAKKIITLAVEVLEIRDVSAAELIHQYLKITGLKGGII